VPSAGIPIREVTYAQPGGGEEAKPCWKVLGNEPPTITDHSCTREFDVPAVKTGAEVGRLVGRNRRRPAQTVPHRYA
jgi:hypothetical protein